MFFPDLLRFKGMLEHITLEVAQASIPLEGLKPNIDIHCSCGVERGWGVSPQHANNSMQS